MYVFNLFIILNTMNAQQDHIITIHSSSVVAIIEHVDYIMMTGLNAYCVP